MYSSVSTFRSVVFACAVVGVCQSVIWIALTICAILTFRCVLRTPQYGSDHLIVTTIVKLYFEGDECKVEGGPPGYPDIAKASHAEPIEVFSWMVAFLVISSLHLVLSAYLFKRRSGVLVRSVLREWCFVTFLVCAMDAVLAGTFVRDYFAIKTYMNENEEDEEGIAAAPVALAIIAARGIALWIINTGFLIHFSIFLASNSAETEAGGAGGKGERETAMGVDNRSFETSSECFVHQDGGRRDLASYDASQEVTFYSLMQRNRRSSVSSLSSFEAVTRFNEEEVAGIGAFEKPDSKKERGRSECICHKFAGQQDGALKGQWRRNLYHSHGCPALRSELEQKLATIRGSSERGPNKVQESRDFCHDLRNFKTGGGNSDERKGASQRSGWIPEAPPIP